MEDLMVITLRSSTGRQKRIFIAAPVDKKALIIEDIKTTTEKTDGSSLEEILRAADLSLSRHGARRIAH